MITRTARRGPLPAPVRHAARALIAVLVAFAMLALGESPALAYTRADRAEQIRYAEETMNLGYSAFLDRKADFTRAGCRKEDYENNGFPYPGCSKPSPYNAFNWTDDGCSGREDWRAFVISNAYRDLFNGPCQQHDFGYRNFGKGLTLGRSEDKRAWVDARFRAEMHNLCATRYAGNRLQRGACTAEADAVWAVVRQNPDKWDTPPATPLAPLDPDPAPSAAVSFPVMNTDETPPDGVWFRASPRTGDTDRVDGHGVYHGDHVQLTCYAWGEAVGASANRLWYRAGNVDRPTVSGSPNAGFLNAHYVDDGTVANQVAAGVPPC